MLNVILVSHFGEFLIDYKLINGFVHCLTAGTFNAEICLWSLR